MRVGSSHLSERAVDRTPAIPRRFAIAAGPNVVLNLSMPPAGASAVAGARCGGPMLVPQKPVHADPYDAKAARYFGATPVRDVGLIASEGRMTIPMQDGTPAGVLDVTTHYFEFIPEDQADRPEPETVEATELIA